MQPNRISPSPSSMALPTAFDEIVLGDKGLVGEHYSGSDLQVVTDDSGYFSDSDGCLDLGGAHACAAPLFLTRVHTPPAREAEKPTDKIAPVCPACLARSSARATRQKRRRAEASRGGAALGDSQRPSTVSI